MKKTFAKTMLCITATATAFLWSAHAAAEEEVTVGYQQIVGPYVSAIAMKKFDAPLKAAGYTVKWRQFSSAGDISSALASGGIPIGVLGSTGIAAAATRGVDMQLFWILDNIGHSEALVVRKASGISKPEDLKGKRVGVPFVSTSHFHLLVALSKVWKMNPRDVRILNMQPPQIVAAWQRGDIDAAYVWPPALTTLLKDGTVLTDSEEVGKASVPTFDGIVVDKGWAEKNPKFMQAYTQVLADAYRDYNQNGAKWTAESPEVKGNTQMIGGDPKDILEAMKMLVFPTPQDMASNTWLGGGSASGAVKALTESANFLKEQKQIDSTLPDYSGFVNATWAEQTAKQK